MIPGSICDIGCDMVVNNGNDHDHVKTLCTGTGYNIYLMLRCASIAIFLYFRRRDGEWSDIQEDNSISMCVIDR